MKKAVLSTLSVLLLFSCNLTSGSRHGELSLHFSSVSSRAILPEVTFEPARFDLALTGPGGENITETLNGSSSFNKDDMTPGTWSLSAQAYSKEGALLSEGTDTVEIIKNRVTTKTMTLAAVGGTGSVKLDLSFPGTDVPNPLVKVFLWDYDGDSVDVTGCLTSNADSASFTKDLAAGSYALVVQLYNGADYLWGHAESLWIVGGVETAWDKDLKKIDITDGGEVPEDPTTLALQLVAEIRKPYIMYLSGVYNGTTWKGGEDKTISLRLRENNDAHETLVPDTIEWFVDGQKLAGETGEELTIGSDFHIGRHTISALARKDGRVTGRSVEFYVAKPIKLLSDHNLDITGGNGLNDCVYHDGKYWLMRSRILYGFDENMQKTDEKALSGFETHTGFDLTTDGTYFYVSDHDYDFDTKVSTYMVHKLDPSANFTKVKTFTIDDSYSSFAWDGTHFWAGDDSEFVKFDHDWNEVGRYENPRSLSGMVWVNGQLWISDRSVFPSVMRLDENFQVIEFHSLDSLIPEADDTGNGKTLGGIMHDGKNFWVLNGGFDKKKIYKIEGLLF